MTHTVISPLEITKDAQQHIFETRLSNEVPDGYRLRVESQVNQVLGLLGFKMSFDAETKKTDRIYKLTTLELVLDNETAYHLVGSTLDIDGDGELLFKHLDTTESFQDVSDIVFN